MFLFKSRAPIALKAIKEAKDFSDLQSWVETDAAAILAALAQPYSGRPCSFTVKMHLACIDSKKIQDAIALLNACRKILPELKLPIDSLHLSGGGLGWG